MMIIKVDYIKKSKKEELVNKIKNDIVKYQCLISQKVSFSPKTLHDILKKVSKQYLTKNSKNYSKQLRETC